jgi:hypothetical protein
VAVETLFELGGSRVASVFPEKMAAFAPVADQFIVKLVVEVKGLRFFGVEEFGKNDPPENQAGDQSDDEEQDGESLLVWDTGFCVVCFAHGDSVHLSLFVFQDRENPRRCAITPCH